jgi:alkylation response protein AidB-like acyl-CoA dehydrogenase
LAGGCATLQKNSTREAETCARVSICPVYTLSGKEKAACIINGEQVIYPGQPDWPYGTGVCDTVRNGKVISTRDLGPEKTAGRRVLTLATHVDELCELALSSTAQRSKQNRTADCQRWAARSADEGRLADRAQRTRLAAASSATRRRMEITLSEQDRAFRDEIRAFLTREMPNDWVTPRAPSTSRSAPARFERLRAWQRKVFDARLIGITWPTEYGGRGAPPFHDAILQDEMVRAGAPPTIKRPGHHALRAPPSSITAARRRGSATSPRCSPVRRSGVRATRSRARDRISRALRTRAELRGDDYIVNGQKVWTTDGQYADWMFCLVRTVPEAPKHKGIGFLLIDMHSPGVDVRPLRQLTGGSEFCEVFLNDVAVPRQNMVGEPTEGWQIANTVLGYERGTQALASSSAFDADFDRLLGNLRKAGRSGDAKVRQKAAELKIDLALLRLTCLKTLAGMRDGHAPGSEASMVKLWKSEVEQKLYGFSVDVEGPYGAVWEGDRSPDAGHWHWRMLWSRAGTIYAGTSEIQRNIIAQRVLGLPRE